MADADGTRRKVTRRDVALRAGVSDAVVTYTLTGRAPVAPATAERVRAAIAELGYQPNLAAVALKSGSSRTLAFISPEDDEQPLRVNPFFSSYINAIEEAARGRGYALISTTASHEGTEVLHRLRDFASRQVDGALVLASASPFDQVEMDRVGVPWVELNTISPRVGIDGIGADLHGGAVAAVEHLILVHGHRRIGFVGGGSIDELRRIGWLDACARLGAEATVQVDVPYTPEGGYQAGLRLADDENRPSAVFVVSDFTAIGVLRAFHERGIRVPQEVAIVSFDGAWPADYAWPSLTSVRQPFEEMAAHAVDRVLAGTGKTPTFRQFPVTLVLRASCGCSPTLPE